MHFVVFNMNMWLCEHSGFEVLWCAVEIWDPYLTGATNLYCFSGGESQKHINLFHDTQEQKQI